MNNNYEQQINDADKEISEEMQKVNDRILEWDISRKMSSIDPSVIERNMEDQGGLVDKKPEIDERKKMEEELAKANKIVKSEVGDNYWLNMENFSGIPTGSDDFTADKGRK